VFVCRNFRLLSYFAKRGGVVSADHEAFAAEVGDDFHTPTDGLDVCRQGPELAGVELGTFDGRYPFLADVHPFCNFGPGQSTTLAHLGQPVGTADVDERLSAGLDLGAVSGVGEELGEEAFAVVAVGAAWEAAVCWDDGYALKRLTEVRAV
jgi:hypothetical protein